MSTVDLVASHPHYLAHLLPVWDALPDSLRGTAYLDARLDAPLTGAVEALDRLPSVGGPVLCAGFDDLRRIGGRPIVLMEHGVGQSYKGVPGDPAARDFSYAGGAGRHGVTLFLCPNDYAAQANLDVNPEANVAVIGSPRLEYLRTLPAPPPPKDQVTVGFAFHWGCEVAPETIETFGFWKAAIGKLTQDSRYRILGHAHPRNIGTLAPHYERLGIEVVQTFDEMVTRAHLLAFDNTSAGYEFAGLGRPVVVLNHPEYRRWVEHGLRFWDAAGVGPQCDDPLALPIAIEQAWDQQPWKGADEILARVFPEIEDPAMAAVAAIESVLGLKPAVARTVPSFPKTSKSLSVNPRWRPGAPKLDVPQIELDRRDPGGIDLIPLPEDDVRTLPLDAD